MTDQKNDIDLPDLIAELQELQQDARSFTIEQAITAIKDLAAMPEGLRRAACCLKKEDSWIFSVVTDGDLQIVIRPDNWGRAYANLDSFYFDSIADTHQMDPSEALRYAARLYKERMQTWLDENSSEPLRVRLEITLEPSEISPTGDENE